MLTQVSDTDIIKTPLKNPNKNPSPLLIDRGIYSLVFSTTILLTIEISRTNTTKSAELAMMSTKKGNLKFCKNSFIIRGFSSEVRHSEPNQLTIEANSFKNPLISPTSEVSSKTNTKNVSKPDSNPIFITHLGGQTSCPLNFQSYKSLN
jgi:hypothetical protein